VPQENAGLHDLWHWLQSLALGEKRRGLLQKLFLFARKIEGLLLILDFRELEDFT
jgi:hypothetical protein